MRVGWRKLLFFALQELMLFFFALQEQLNLMNATASQHYRSSSPDSSISGDEGDKEEEEESSQSSGSEDSFQGAATVVEQQENASVAVATVNSGSTASSGLPFALRKDLVIDIERRGGIDKFSLQALFVDKDEYKANPKLKRQVENKVNRWKDNKTDRSQRDEYNTLVAAFVSPSKPKTSSKASSTPRRSKKKEAAPGSAPNRCSSTANSRSIGSPVGSPVGSPGEPTFPPLINRIVDAHPRPFSPVPATTTMSHTLREFLRSVKHPPGTLPACDADLFACCCDVRRRRLTLFPVAPLSFQKSSM